MQLISVVLHSCLPFMNSKGFQKDEEEVVLPFRTRFFSSRGETSETLENERIALLSELKKRDNEVVIKAKMEKTFSQRRLEIVEQRPMIGDFKSRWPALFQQSE
ncbi:hypothetical protein NQZ68_010267, partial [Dissostichus eleginoides]